MTISAVFWSRCGFTAPSAARSAAQNCTRRVQRWTARTAQWNMPKGKAFCRQRRAKGWRGGKSFFPAARLMFRPRCGVRPSRRSRASTPTASRLMQSTRRSAAAASRRWRRRWRKRERSRSGFPTQWACRRNSRRWRAIAGDLFKTAPAALADHDFSLLQ